MANQAIEFTGKGELRLAERPLPEVGPGDVLVETEVSLISTGTECICYNRWFEPGTHWDQWVKYPFSPGYSNVGVIRAAGAEVKGLTPGQRVATRRPHVQRFVARSAELGTGLFLVPEGVSSEAASWFGLGKITQLGVRAAPHALGDDVAIVGGGLLGQLVTQYVRLLGARSVTVIDTATWRLEVAKAHGATHTVAGPVGEALEAVREATSGRLASVVYDITGNADVLAQALPLVRDFGTLVILGDTGTPSGQRLTSDVIRRGLRIVSAHDGHAPAEANRHVRWSTGEIVDLFFTYLARGDMRVDDMISLRCDPRDAKAVYDRLTTDRSGLLGVVFDWSQLR